jgi:hypothetical protein
VERTTGVSKKLPSGYPLQHSSSKNKLAVKPSLFLKLAQTFKVFETLKV